MTNLLSCNSICLSQGSAQLREGRPRGFEPFLRYRSQGQNAMNAGMHDVSHPVQLRSMQCFSPLNLRVVSNSRRVIGSVRQEL